MTDNNKKHLIIFSKADYQSPVNLQNTDLAIAFASFNQTVNILFIDQGVLQLLNTNKYHKKILALEEFGIEAIYVSMSSLDKHEILSKDIILNNTQYHLLEDESLAKLLASHDSVFHY